MRPPMQSIVECLKRSPGVISAMQAISGIQSSGKHLQKGWDTDFLIIHDPCPGVWNNSDAPAIMNMTM